MVLDLGGSRKKIVCVCAIMRRGRLGQMGWRPLQKGSLSANGLFSQSVPGPQVFGNVPMLALTGKTP